MPCCCETNLKAAFVLGIIDLVLGCVFFAFQNFIDGPIGVVLAILLIVGAKAPNATVLLVWMVLACLQCAEMIGIAIYGLVVGAAVATSAEVRAEVKALHSDSKAAIGAIAILSIVYVVGVIMFQIWTIIVANKARKEIDQGIKI